MSRKLLSLTLFGLLFTLFFLVSTGSIRAQSDTPTTGDDVRSPACPTVGWSCADVEDLGPNLNNSHSQHLTMTGLPGRDSHGDLTPFVIACGMSTPDKGFLLTTGNPTLDTQYCLGSNTFSILSREYGYFLDLDGFSNPFTAEDGNIDVVVTPGTNDNYDHMCFIGWLTNTDVVGSEDEGGDSSDENTASSESYSLEYSTFVTTGVQASCTSVYADPFGRVYNSQLRPVPGSSVTLFDYAQKTKFSAPGVPNPVTTNETGMFNFNVPPGRTYLETNLANLTSVHANHYMAYSTPPYVYGDMIIEEGQIEQRDIPVSGGNTPLLRSMGYSNIRTGNTLLIQGSASWPLTLIDVLQGSTSIAQQQSDEFGRYRFDLTPSKIDPTQQITVKLTAVDLTVDPASPAQNAPTDEIVFDPIPTYVEGYAYDTNGNILPFAKVRLVIKTSGQIAYETSADGNGFFKVSPKYVPIFPFYLEFIASNTLPGSVITGGITGVPGTTGTVGTTGAPLPTQPGSFYPTAGAGETDVTTEAVQVSIMDFAKQNQEYFDVNAVDIMAGTVNGAKVDPTAVADSSTAVFAGTTSAEVEKVDVDTKKVPVTTQTDQQRYATILVLVFLLILVGTGALLLLKKRGKHALEGDSGDTYTKAGDDSDDVGTPTGE